MLKHGRKEGNQQVEAQKYLESRRMMGNKLVEKWSRVSVGAKLDEMMAKSPERARNTAMLIENQERHMKRLTETIISQTFSTRPENVLKVVRIGVANSNRGDIFTEFPLTTTDDAIYFIDMTYESALRGSTAGDKIYEKVNHLYAGEMAEMATIGTGATQYTIVTTYYPVVIGKCLILLDRILVGTDDGDGTITRVGTYLKETPSATYQTMTYSTGTFKIEFDAAVTSAHTINIMYQFDSEKSTLYDYMGKVSLAVRKERFNARPMPLGYTYTTMTELVLGTTGLGNVEDMLIGSVGDEHAKARDYKSIALARSVALTNTTYTFNCDFAAEGEVSDKMHAQKISAKIGSIGGAIYNDIKRGKANKAVVGSNALEYLKKHDLWKDDTTQPRSGVFYAGRISDVDVYCCPSDANLVTTDEILLTYKNPEEGMDVGLAFGVLTELTASLAYPQFYVDGNIATVEDYLIINKKFVRLLSLTNLTI